jgi:hypothetical protein
MNRSSQLKLGILPRVFQADNGEVDYRLLELIFSYIPRASGEVRNLLKYIGGIKLRPNDKPFCRLSIELTSSDFRKEWYQRCHTPNRKILKPFFSIAEEWIHQKHPNLRRDSKELDQFFEKRGDRYFPRLENIEILSNQLSSTARESLSESAIYAWSLIESSTWFSYSHPSEESLTCFRDVLLTDLKKRQADNLLAQLEDGVYLSNSNRHQLAESPSLQRGTDSIRTIEIGREKTSNIDLEPDSVKKLKQFCEGKFRLLEALAERAITEQQQVAVRVNGILSTDDPINGISEIVQSLEKLKETSSLAHDVVKAVEAGITDLVAVTMQRINLRVTPVKMRGFSFAANNHWKEDASSCIDVAINVLWLANNLEKFNEELLKAVTRGNPENAIPLKNAAAYLMNMEAEATQLFSGLEAMQTLRGLLEAKEEDFTWNPVLDRHIPSKCWFHTGEYLALKGSTPRILGICARKEYPRLQAKVAEFIDSLAKREDMRLEDAFDVVTSMTLGQLEELECETEEGRTILASIEFESFLQIADIASTEAYAFLSARPLSNYLNEQQSTAAGGFFKTAFEALTREGGTRLNVVEFYRLIMSACSGSVSNPIQHEDIFAHKLITLLNGHPRGEPIYPQLWQFVQDDICRALKEKANEGKLNEAAKYYKRFRNRFDLEEHLSEWISKIPPRYRNRSEYERKLRPLVQAKLDELDAWLQSYESEKRLATNETEDGAEVLLKRSITEVLLDKGASCRVLNAWFQLICRSTFGGPNHCVTPTRNQELNAGQVLYRGNEDAFHPRVFLATTNGRDATVADFLADELFLRFGLYQVKSLAKAYAEQQHFEAFTALSMAGADHIPVDIDRRVEAAIDDLEVSYLNRIEAIAIQLDALDQQNAELLRSSLVEIQSCINLQKWTKANSELCGVEQTLKELLNEEKGNRQTRALRAEITALGGNPPMSTNLEVLQEARAQAFAESKPRRQHLDCLAKLTAVEGLDVEVRNEFLAAQLILERPEHLPGVARSAEVAYIFSETVEFLREQIRRSRVFVASYKQRLNFLALAVAKCLKQYGVDEGSFFVSSLVESEREWRRIPNGEIGVIELLLEKLSPEEIGAVQISEPDIDVESTVLATVPAISTSPAATRLPESYDIFAGYIDRLANALSRISKEIQGLDELGSVSPKRDNKLSEVSLLALIRFQKCDDAKSEAALAHLTDWSVSMLREHEDLLSTDECAAALHMINRFQDTASVRALLPTKSSKGRLGDLTTHFLARVSKDCGLPALSNPVEQVQQLSENIARFKTRGSLFAVSFSPIGNNDSLTARTLWDSYSGDARQAEARASLMNILWQTSAPLAVACCMRYAPIEMDSRTAEALANIADQALSKGRVDLLQSYVDLQRTINAKPFQLFVGLLLSKMPTKADPPAEISLVGPLEHQNEHASLNGILRIKSRRSDSPDSITLRLPQSSPLFFDSGVTNKVLKGPFIDEEVLLPVNFRLREKDAHNFTIPVDCEATSITGVASTFSIRLDFQILGKGSFYKIPVEEIEEAFQHFPHGQMRGEDYIHRPDNERRIENDLFKSKSIRSLWISSPRRSGKTTMLYRVLDAFSHKAHRDNLIAYFSLNKSFDSTTMFNEWVWKSVKRSVDNAELRSLFDNFSELGRDLPFDADVGTFIEILADRLRTSSKKTVTRTVFLFDEIDKLATMYFEGGVRKDTADEIAWQLRHLIGRRREIGFVFAGSSAAKKIFLTNHDAPFFNAGILFELSPFSCDSQAGEINARAIIEPPRLRGRLTIPKPTLEHMLWICSGIPYYMKLLAGATYSMTRQSHVLISDVNEGLHALLEKRTGICRLDEVEGDPGSDELRTIALEKGEDRLLTQAVLYAVAELESPLSGHPIRRGRLYGASSPLVTRYQLPRQAVERGLDRAIELGLLKLSSDSPPQISFAIPILGESIRHACGSYWAEIDHPLEQLGNKLRFNPT